MDLLLRERRQEHGGLPVMWKWMFDGDDFVSWHTDEMFMGQMGGDHMDVWTCKHICMPMCVTPQISLCNILRDTSLGLSDLDVYSIFADFKYLSVSSGVIPD